MMSTSRRVRSVRLIVLAAGVSINTYRHLVNTEVCMGLYGEEVIGVGVGVGVGVTYSLVVWSERSATLSARFGLCLTMCSRMASSVRCVAPQSVDC